MTFTVQLARPLEELIPLIKEDSRRAEEAGKVRRKYKNDAERSAAYRQRKRERKELESQIEVVRVRAELRELHAKLSELRERITRYKEEAERKNCFGNYEQDMLIDTIKSQLDWILEV
jgi:hypothetical protein